MRLGEVRAFLDGRPGEEDVSLRFGASKGRYNAAEVTRLIAGHADMESLELTSDGSALVVRDRRETEFGTFQPPSWKL